MSGKSIQDCPEEALVKAALEQAEGEFTPAEAVRELVRRSRSFFRWMKSKTVNPGQVCAATGHNDLEGLFTEALGKAVLTYKAGRGASFKTYLAKIVKNAIAGSRRRKVPVQPLEEDGEAGALQAKPCRQPRPGSDEHLLLMDVMALAGKCLKSKTFDDKRGGDRYRTIFILGTVVGLSPRQIRELLPELTEDNVKQLKHRAEKKFEKQWELLGGPVLANLVDVAAHGMNRKSEEEKIQDPAARRVFAAWRGRRSLEAAASALSLDLETARQLLLKAILELYGKPGLRAPAPEAPPAAPPAEGSSEAPEASPGGSQRTLELVRAAFGFAPLENLSPSLGAFVQGRLESASSYDEACKALKIKPGVLRDLVLGRLKPEESLYRALARHLRMPLEDLKALPVEPPGVPAFFRSGTSLDENRLAEGVLSMLKTPHRRRNRGRAGKKEK